MTPYAKFFQVGERAAKFNISAAAYEHSLRIAFLSGKITEDDEEAFWDGFYSVERHLYYI